MLDRVGVVWEHEETGLIFLWRGSHTVNIYDGWPYGGESESPFGNELDVLSFGYGENEPLTEAQAVEAIETYVQAQTD